MMLPSWAAVESAALEGGLKTDHLGGLRQLHERIISTPELASHAQECCENLLSPNLDKALFDRDFQNAELEQFYLLIVLMCHDASRLRFQQLGMTVDEFNQTWTDIGNWPNYHIRNYNFAGLQWRFVHWYGYHLNGRIVQLGRLQFEHHRDYSLDKSVIQLADGSLKVWPYGQPLPENSRLVVEKGQPVIDIHIPEGGRLDINACRQSIAAAVAFMARCFPDYPYRAFECHSWLLDTQFAEFLPQESNILKFQHLGGIVFNDGTPPETLWRLFGNGISPENIGDAKPHSELQRGVVEFIRKGGTLSNGLLVIPRAEAEKMA